ncbi:MAG TPA: hypothetical protein VG709_05270 [Actinomycetota bacterium]|nr:hypothetical protein [Actinomycetota bacterium]
MDAMTLSEWLSFAIGCVEIVLAIVVLRHVARFARTFPWLIALMLFFVLRGADRIYAGLTERGSLGLLVDVLVLAVLVLLLLGIEGTVGGLQAARDAAANREAEYARALADYRRLARHRLANPLTVIRGGVLTLKGKPDLDAETRERLLDTIDQEALRLERVALEPDAESEEEAGLRPRPRA